MDVKNKEDFKQPITDYIYNVDNFNQQLKLEDNRALVNIFLNLVFMEKNTIQKLPDMGFDLHSKKHKLDNKKELMSMEKELREQCETYLPRNIHDLSFEKENISGDVKIEVEIKDLGKVKVTFEDEDNLEERIKVELPDKEF